MNHLRRFLGLLAGGAVALLALAATAPAALAIRVPPPGGYGGTVQAPPQVHTIVTGGMPGWQITLIAVAGRPARGRRGGTPRSGMGHPPCRPQNDRLMCPRTHDIPEDWAGHDRQLRKGTASVAPPPWRPSSSTTIRPAFSCAIEARHLRSPVTRSNRHRAIMWG